MSKVVVVSFQRVGSSMLWSLIVGNPYGRNESDWNTSPEYYDICEKHHFIRPEQIPKDWKVIFVFGDPIVSAISYSRMLGNSDICLREDSCRMEELFDLWMCNTGHEKLCLRYETLFKYKVQIESFIGRKLEWPVWKKRRTSRESVSNEVLERLESVYSDISLKIKNAPNYKFFLNKKIVDIGCGSNPEPTAHIVTDLYMNGDTTSRGTPKLEVLPHQTLVQCDIESMPFEDKEFDYSYCKHVLEHINNPEKACKEIMRISKAGYIETPTSLWEKLFGRKFHLWLVSKDGNKLVFIKKPKGFKDNTFNGDLLYKDCKLFNKMFKENIDLFSVRFHWKEYFEVEVL